MTWPTSRPGYPPLPEDPGERAIFDQRATQLGGSMLAVLSALEAMQAMAPQQGSHGKYLAVMVNEVRKAVADLDAAVQAERDAIVAAVEAIRCSPVGSGVRDRIAEVILARSAAAGEEGK